MSNPSLTSGVWPDGTKWQYQEIDPSVEESDYSAVFGLHFDAGKILLTKNHRGWDIPGGGIENGELPADALRREMYEECGFTVKTLMPFGMLYLELPGDSMLVKGFLVEGNTTLEPVTAEECTEASYHRLESDEVRSAQKAVLINHLYDSQ